jgi:hypothetical protein
MAKDNNGSVIRHGNGINNNNIIMAERNNGNEISAMK